MTRSVAIIIPCYNSSKTLKRAIDSAINQSFKVTEIIVVDDFSDDSIKIQEICSKYGKIVKYIKNGKNIGLAGSRNVGIWSAKSNIVAFLDADDQYHYKKIEVQLKYLTNKIEPGDNSINKQKKQLQLII